MTTETATKPTKSTPPSEPYPYGPDNYPLGEMVKVPLSDLTLVLDKSHPLYDPRATDKEKSIDALAFDLGQDGQLQNIVATHEDGKNLIVAGRRRFRAAQKMGKEWIWTLFVDTNTAVKMLKTMIKENELRRGDSLVRKSVKLKRLWEEMEREHLEKFAEGETIIPLTKKERIEAASEVFGVGKDQIENYSLLAYNASVKVLSAAEKKLISDSIAIEIVRKFPDSHERQEKMLNKLLATDKGRVKKDFLKPIGERPIKAGELKELALDSAYISSSTKVPLKAFALFLSGGMSADEREKFLASNEPVAVWAGGGPDEESEDLVEEEE